MHAACGHSRWHELSRGTQLSRTQLDQCVTIFRWFCLRRSWDALTSSSSCSSSLAQRSHRSARRFQTRLFSRCGLKLAMTLHSVANFKNRSAAVCIEASFVGYPTTAGNQKLFLPLIARPRFPIALIWTSACDAGVIAEEFTPIGGWECRARNLSRQRGGSRGNGLGRSSANGYSLPQE